MQKHRISTDIGKDQVIKVELNQDYELLEILSLKFTQKEAYASYCSDYGVVVGRIIINNGLGVPNARVSIFIPLDEIDSTDPVISKLYPYTSVTDRNEDNYRYNLLPSRKQHGGHEPTGTFPDQSDILTREEVLEVYDKYYKYTVKTNDSGDFMIWGVPLGSQTIHVDVDLSDMGCFSLRPYDFLKLGYGEDLFKNSFSFKSSDDIDSLPQIVKFDKTIEVFPLWGNESICEIGITRTDFDLSSLGVKLEPKAYLIGGIYTDTNKNSINKNCQVRRKMGRKCDLTTKSGRVESIRFTHRKDEDNRPILENYDLGGDIPDDGGFVIPVPMNTEFLYTNEFGENEYTNNPNKGVATAACYRFRFSMDDSGNERVRKTASYLVPNIREYQTSEEEKEKSYAFSTNWTDYPTDAINRNYEKIDELGILYNIDGQYFPRDYFFRMSYNKVYTVSSFHSMYYHKSNFTNDRYVGLKELVPTEEEDCSDNVTPPVNYGTKNKTFQLLITEVVLFMEQLFNLVTLIFFNTITKIFHVFANAVNFWPIKKLSTLIRKFAYRFQNSTQKQLFLINYPECEECNGENNQYGIGVDDPGLGYCEVGTISFSGSTIEDPNNRKLLILSYSFNVPSCPGAFPITRMSDFMIRQTSYMLTSNSIGISLSGSPISYSSDLSGYTFNDSGQKFPDSELYNVTIRDINHYTNTVPNGTIGEGGCELYDVPYNEDLINLYYIGTERNEKTPSQYDVTMDVTATNLSDDNEYELIDEYDGDVYQPITKSGFVEFSNGVFNIIPGTLSNKRLIDILKEYRRRKRVGKLFCGGIVNYSFIDNWMSGSLYFILFKGKKGKYCSDVIRYSNPQEKYYYRSSIYSGSTFGTNIWSGDENPTRYLGRPTTIVDLGPRDEFIKEICVDPNLDPNCSVARSIGPTSFQTFGDILGLAINYRMDVSNNDYDINNFFGNKGFNLPKQKILSGDILQIISINNETGIEEFDLQTTRYAGYSYQYLDPDSPKTKGVFYSGGTYGPLPITLYLDEDGERVRACLNENGRLTESSQKIPFFLWDKKGTGFGKYDEDDFGNQSWYYSLPQVQPLQGMTYAYNLTGSTSDKYLLLPITYTFSGLTISTSGDTSNDVDFDIITSKIGGHFTYNYKYPGFTVLEVSSGTTENPLAGRLYTRVGDVGNNDNGIVNGWHQQSWKYTDDFIIRRTQDYYNGNRQILSTPFLFYFGLKSGKTGLDKFIKYFGDKNDFTPAE